MDNLTVKKQKALANEYWKEVSKRPPFIDGKTTTHIRLREVATDLMGDLATVFEPDFLNKDTITYLKEIFVLHCDNMYNVYPTLAIDYLIYIYNILEVYKDAAEGLEIYETAQNINLLLTLINDEYLIKGIK